MWLLNLSKRLGEANPAELGLLGEVKGVAPGICGLAFSWGAGWHFPTQILMLYVRHLSEQTVLFFLRRRFAWLNHKGEHPALARCSGGRSCGELGWEDGAWPCSPQRCTIRLQLFVQLFAVLRAAREAVCVPGATRRVPAGGDAHYSCINTCHAGLGFVRQVHLRWGWSLGRGDRDWQVRLNSLTGWGLPPKNLLRAAAPGPAFPGSAAG